LCSFVGYYLEVFEKIKIFRQKGYKEAFFNGYYLRKEIFEKVAVFCHSRWLPIEGINFFRQPYKKALFNGYYLREEILKKVAVFCHSRWLLLEGEFCKRENHVLKMST